ncbi:MAG: PEGA domain-containing protein [Verrucomicrobia bacterium]|nr:PEGA domain-containing protein [Verrucomicrobiota bacterium]MBT6788023.1 PEGA domain-containing protein [Verrucomicrobiota bacterium]
MKYTIKIVTVVLVVICSGCRTTKETLYINSDPTGARVTLSNGMTGATPCTFVVPLKEKTVVTIEKDGYEPALVTVAKKVSKKMVAGRAAMAVLILPLAAIGGSGGGMGSDVIGPVSKLEPNPVSVKLLPLHKELPPQKKPAD